MALKRYYKSHNSGNMNRTSLIYGRVSSENDRQSTDRQTYSLNNLIKSNGDILVHEPFTEHISGAKANSERVVLMECLNYAKDNNIDIIYFSSVDRMGRAIWQVLESIKFCLDNHINCYFQKEQMGLYLEDGSENPFLAIFISVISTCASIERDSIKFRLNDARAKKIAEAITKDVPRAKEYSDHNGPDGQYTSLQIENNGHCQDMRCFGFNNPATEKGVRLVNQDNQRLFRI